ncbi:hypothetical protein WCE10_21375 [Cronobacter muytjensii]|uniref:hypothetical protein n=1 Tax=Cronobacter muytjensii TaxID=413501 RepID=UPI0034D77FB4
MQNIITADDIKATFEDSGMDRHDMEQAIAALKQNCADEFEGEEQMVAFLMGE